MKGTTHGVSVIIPTHNRLDGLVDLIGDIKRQAVAFDQVEVLVVNSPAGDDCREAVESLSDGEFRVRYIVTENALSIKRNKGADVAAFDCLIFLDDDMRLEDGYLVAIVGMLSLNPGAAVCSEVVFYPAWVREQNYYRFKNLQHKQVVAHGSELKSNRFVAMSFTMNKNRYLEIGGFDEEFVKYGGEDQAFAYQCNQLSVPILFCETARAIHAEVRSGADAFAQKLYDASFYSMPILFDKWPASRLPTSSAIPYTMGRFLQKIPGRYFLRLAAAAMVVLGNFVTVVLSATDSRRVIGLRFLYLAQIILFSSGGYWDSISGHSRRRVGLSALSRRRV